MLPLNLLQHGSPHQASNVTKYVISLILTEDMLPMMAEYDEENFMQP